MVVLLYEYAILYWIILIFLKVFTIINLRFVYVVDLDDTVEHSTLKNVKYLTGNDMG